MSLDVFGSLLQEIPFHVLREINSYSPYSFVAHAQVMNGSILDSEITVQINGILLDLELSQCQS